MFSRSLGIGIAVALLVSLVAVWLLRDVGASPLVVAAVGDTSGYRILEEPGMPRDPLAAVRPMLGESDLFLFNYEGVILESSPEPEDCPPQAGQSTFYTATPIVASLRAAPVTIATLANNHVLDCGAPGIAQTLDALESGGIHTVGAGASLETACRPLVVERAGRKLAFLAFLARPDAAMCAAEDAAGAACYEQCDARGRIADLSAQGHTVFVSLHLHLAQSWTNRAHDSHVELVRDALAAGANVIVGHGPHIPQGVIAQKRGVGLPSLGNFLFKTDYPMPRAAHSSVIARLTIGDGPVDMSLHPIEIGRDGIPYPAPRHSAASILHEIAWLSEPFETRLRVVESEAFPRAELNVGP